MKKITLAIICMTLLINSSAFSQNKTNKMDSIITMLVTFNIKTGKVEEFKNALLDNLKNTHHENGNIMMELYEDKNSPNTIYFFERWVNQEALDYHFNQPYVQKVFELSKTYLSEPMEILYLQDIEPKSLTDLKRPSSKDKPVDLAVVFEVKEGMQEQFIKQFRKSVIHSRQEAGNITFDFHTVEGDDTKFVLFERWKNQEALDYHFEQPYLKECFELFETTLTKPVDESINYLKEIGI